LNGERQPFWGYFDLVLLLAAVVPALALSTATLVAVSALAGPLRRATSALFLQFFAYGLWFLALYAILRLRYGKPFWASLGWGAPPGAISRGLLLGPVLALSIALLGHLLRTPDMHVPMMDLLDSPEAIALVGIFAVTLGPFCEELIFRGFLMPLLARTFGSLLAIVIAATPFALLHGPQYAWSWRHVLLIGLAGAAFGWYRQRTGSTSAAAALHATYNLTFFTGFLLTQGDKLPQW
jgi:membrane protease YdiL (CAAX protease family)